MNLQNEHLCVGTLRTRDIFPLFFLPLGKGRNGRGKSHERLELNGGLKTEPTEDSDLAY